MFNVRRVTCSYLCQLICWVLLLLFLFSLLLKNFKLTLGPSLEIWRFFERSSPERPSVKCFKRSVEVLCPKNMLLQNLTWTLFDRLTQNLMIMSISYSYTFINTFIKTKISASKTLNISSKSLWNMVRFRNWQCTLILFYRVPFDQRPYCLGTLLKTSHRSCKLNYRYNLKPSYFSNNLPFILKCWRNGILRKRIAGFVRTLWLNCNLWNLQFDTSFACCFSFFF